LIIGCGYIGLPLALQLQEKGHEVSGWVRSATTAASLAGHRLHRIITGSVGDPLTWKQAATITTWRSTAPHRAGAASRLTRSFQGGRFSPEPASGPSPPSFCSSTSVYGETKGEIVTERPFRIHRQ